MACTLKQLEAARRYYKQHRELCAKRRKQYYEKHKEQEKAQATAWLNAHPERKRELEIQAASRRLRFKGVKLTVSKEPVRIGKCTECGAQGLTNLHHWKYDDRDPLAHTQELCVPCHARIHVTDNLNRVAS
jgi:hypothetical protein